MTPDRLLPIYSPDLTTVEKRLATKAIEEEWISSQGPYCLRFEKQFGEFANSENCVVTANCTLALETTLRALEIGPGDEVIVPNLTFISPVNMVTSVGAKPVFADVDEASWTLTKGSINKLVNSRTKAVIAVHAYSDACEIVDILKLCQRHNLFLIEDVAESLGSKVAGRSLGTYGTFGCFSFFANKTITTGEGGALITDDDKLAQKARLIRDHGMTKEQRYVHKVHGSNFRMTSMQAALGIGQLQRFEEIKQKKLKIEKQYQNRLMDIEAIKFKLPVFASESVPWLHTISLTEGKQRDHLIDFMRLGNIEVRPMVYPVTEAEHYKHSANAKLTPNCYSISSKSLHLPSSPKLSEEQVNEVCDRLIEFFDEK